MGLSEIMKIRYIGLFLLLTFPLQIVFSQLEIADTESVENESIETKSKNENSDDDALLAEIVALTGGDDTEIEENTEQESSNGSSGLNISFSGYNLLQSLYGYKATRDAERKSFFFTEGSVENLKQNDSKIIKPDPFLCIPWYYVQNLFNFSIDVNKFTFSARFKINEPSMGIIGPQFFQEFIDKRTFAYQGEYISIQAGHFETTFGRGLTLNLAENENVGKTNLLDGLHMGVEFDFLSLQVLVGRDKVKKLHTFSNEHNVLPNEVADSTGFIVERINYPNTILGIHGESYLFSRIPFLDFLSASSIGGGVINYRSNVDTIVKIITTNSSGSKHLYYQNRMNSVLPSGFLNLSIGNISFYAEYAQLISNEHKVILDTNDNYNYITDTLLTNMGFNLYTSIGAELGKFYILLEGINYWYNKDSTGSILPFANYLDVPECRYKQKWHLLNKEVAKGHPEDQIGFNSEINFNLSDNTSFLATYNQTGIHENNSLFFSYLENYEAYFEWNQNIKDVINFKAGGQFGKSEFRRDIDLLTLATQIDIKPFSENHLFGLTFEYQTKSKEVQSIAQSINELKKELQDYFDDSNIPITVENNEDFDTDKEVVDEYIGSVGAMKKISDEPIITNFFAAISYSFSSVFSIKFQFEQETRYYTEGTLIFSGDPVSKTHFYKSLVLGCKPTEKINFELEIGSFSERDECSAAGCVIVPAYKGIKLIMNTIF